MPPVVSLLLAVVLYQLPYTALVLLIAWRIKDPARRRPPFVAASLIQFFVSTGGLIFLITSLVLFAIFYSLFILRPSGRLR